MEIDDILKEIGETYSRMSAERDKASAKSDDSEVLKLRKEVEELTKENKQLRELSQKVLEVVDATNTKLREAIKERDELQNKVGSVKVIDEDRKKYYNEATTLRKKEAAYAKALGNIHGALETLASELK
jgi:myosin heavy subunit